MARSFDSFARNWRGSSISSRTLTALGEIAVNYLLEFDDLMEISPETLYIS